MLNARLCVCGCVAQCCVCCDVYMCLFGACGVSLLSVLVVWCCVLQCFGVCLVLCLCGLMLCLLCMIGLSVFVV